MSCQSPTAARRRALAACLLGLLLLTAACGGPAHDGGGRAKTAAEWTRPYAGYLPQMNAPGRAVFLVRDAATGRPIRGAVITRHEEMEMGPDGWAPAEGRAVTDEFGLAWIDVPPDAFGEGRDAHYAMDAKGYAPTEEYGVCPETTVDLERGLDRHGRITDALGRPAAGIEVEYKMGCGHSPALRRVRANADGVFVLPCISDRAGEATFFGPGILASYFSAARMRPIDEAPPTYVAEAGIRVRGTILGLDPATLDPGIVCAASTARGSRARVQPDGSFVIEGCEPGAMLQLFYPPEGMWHQLFTDYLRPGGPFEWDVPRIERDANPPPREESATVTVEVLDIDTRRPARPVSIYFDNERDGYRYELFVEDESPDSRALELPPGSYQVSAGAADTEWIADPRRMVIDESTTDPIVLHVRRQAQPKIEWQNDAPEHDAWICGVLDHGSLWSSTAEMAEWIPQEGTVLLVVIRDDRVLHVPFGPSDGRNRIARPSWPKPTRVRLLTSEESYEEGEFTLSGLEVELVDEDGVFVFETVQHGRLRLAVTHQDGRSASQVIRLPNAEGMQVDVETLALPAPRIGTLTVRDGTGRVVPGVGVDFYTPAGDHRGEERTDDAGRVRSPLLAKDVYVSLGNADGDWNPSRRLLAGALEHEVRLGAAEIEVVARSPDDVGIRDLVVYLDGAIEAYGSKPAPAVRWRGLDAGPHTLIVAANGYAPQVARVVLAQGEKRRVELVLTPPD